MKDDEIFLEGLHQLIDMQVDAGVSGVLVAGGTGEHGALTSDERRKLARSAADAVQGRMALFVQTGALTTREAVELSQDAEALGADGLLLTAPYGEAITWREKLAYYEHVNDAVSCPIMLYNTHAAGLMGLDEVAQLASLSNVGAIKHSASDGTLLGDLLAWSAVNDFAVYTGWDDLAAPASLGGARGALLGAGNVVPELVVEVLGLCAQGRLSPELKASWAALRPFLRFIGSSENYVSVVKLGAQLRGLDVGDVRAPYLMPRDDERRELTAQLRRLGLLG